MSIQFNNTSTDKGLVQTYEKEIGAKIGDVSGSTALLKSFAADANIALDDFWSMAIPASGKWQLDDSGHTDYPIITANLVSSQRDYSFTTDGSSNLILDIYRVFVKQASTGSYVEIFPVDQQSDSNTVTFTDGQNTTGIPTKYDKTGNGIFLDVPPSYNSTNGLKIFINREASYFSNSDTTKKPGVTGIFHRYFAIKPALDYARRNNLTSHNRLQEEVLKMEAAIKYHYAGRERGTRRSMTPLKQNNK